MNPITEALQGILKALGAKDPIVVLEHPDTMSFGDYTTNAALAYSKELKEKPFSLAQKIVAELEKKQIAHVEKISIAGPGFINISLDRTFFSESIKKIIAENRNFGKNHVKKDEKIIIEYTNTNVLKPLHIGHLMGNIIGESLSRIYEESGAKVKRNTYQGDVGLHVAKAVWGMRALGFEMPDEKAVSSAKADFIGKAYAFGSAAYEDDLKAAEEIKMINKVIFDESDKEIMKLYVWGRQASLDHFEELYKKLGTKFDYYFFESEVSADALKIVREFLKKGIFEESEGAIVFKGETFDPKLHTRVFVTSQGVPTYEAKDIAHAIRKYKAFSFDQAIIVTANEQNDYFSVMLSALGQIDKKIAERTTHLSHGILKLPTGKMSSRSGDVITGEALIDSIEGLVKEKIKDRDFSDKEKMKITEEVAIGAIKYSILRQSPGSDIVFDPDVSVSFEGDSGPYLQYASVRAGSILAKADALDLKPKVGLVPEEITHLEKMLYRFPEIVERALAENAPHYIVLYLTALASAFNGFYANNKIIDEKDPYSPYKLALTHATKTVLDNGLNVLGIKVPEKM